MFYSKFKELVNDKSKETYTVEGLLDYFGESTILVGLIISNIITSLPLPPWGGGLETLPGGILSIIFASQGLLGLEHIYLPEWMKKTEINVTLLTGSDFMPSVFEFVDNHIVPGREKWIMNRTTEILMYVLVIANALLMLVPIMFTNGPPSQSITAMAFTWLLGDGLYFMICLGIACFVFIFYVFLGIVFSKWLYRTRRYWSFGVLGRKRR